MLNERKKIARCVVYNNTDIYFNVQENLGMYFYKV